MRRFGVVLMTGWLSACLADDPFPSGDPEAFLIAVLPDTQIYARSYPELFHAQTAWIAENAESHRIRLVLHEGDVVDDNGEAQWSLAERALRRLDGRVPYVVALGNHDYGPNGSASDRSTRFFDHFPDAELRARPGFGGAFEDGRTDNGYHLLEMPGGPWLVMSLEFGPRDPVVDWAASVLAGNASIPAILVTHAYMYHDDTRYDRATRPDQRWSPYEYGVARLEGGVNDGEQLYRKLVQPHPNVQLVFSGHVLGDGTGLLTSPQEGGSEVHQMLSNYQNRSRGGDAYLRLVEVHPSLGRIRVRTFSPALGRYRDEADDAFDLPLPELP